MVRTNEEFRREPQYMTSLKNAADHSGEDGESDPVPLKAAINLSSRWVFAHWNGSRDRGAGWQETWLYGADVLNILGERAIRRSKPSLGCPGGMRSTITR